MTRPLLYLAIIALLLPSRAAAQESRSVLPFSTGEVLEYKAAVGKFGALGSGVMRVNGAETVRGTTVWPLSFDYSGRMAFVSIEDRTRSWFDPVRVASLRYTKRERTPLSRTDQDVRMDLVAGRWQSAAGDTGTMPTDAPLDELSFIYFIRTLALDVGQRYTFARHYDAARNPVLISVLRKEQVSVPAGIFDAVVVEMRVRDEERYGGDGVILIHVSDDVTRLPLRIESSMKLVGPLVLSLKGYTPGTAAASPPP